MSRSVLPIGFFPPLNDMKGNSMKKFATLLILLSLGLFSVGMTGCGGDDEKTDDAATDADSGGGDDGS